MVEDVSALKVGDLYTDWAAERLLGHAADQSMDNGVWTGKTEAHPRDDERPPLSPISS